MPVFCYCIIMARIDTLLVIKFGFPLCVIMCLKLDLDLDHLPLGKLFPFQLLIVFSFMCLTENGMFLLDMKLVSKCFRRFLLGNYVLQ